MSNAAATATIAADERQFHNLMRVDCSYNGGSPDGELSISVGGVTVWNVDLVGAYSWSYVFEQGEHAAGIHGAKNEAVVVTLAAGGASVVGKVNALYR